MQFIRYLAAGGAAALANYGSRFVFSLFMPFEMAVVGAFLVGLCTGFLLMRRFAFNASDRPFAKQAGWYAAVNLAALAQTLIISSLMLRMVLPALGAEKHAEAIAHAFGVAIPVLSSYIGHKRWTFRS